MARITNQILSAICIPDPRLFEDLATNDTAGAAAALTSNYTESTPRPGASVPDDDRSRLVPVVSGGQGYDIELVTLNAGSPQLKVEYPEPLGIGYRKAGETGNQVRGWSPPTIPFGWKSVRYTTGSCSQLAVCTVPTTQRVLIAYRFSGDVFVHRWDPKDQSLASAVEVGTDLGAAGGEGLTLIPLPTGRVILTGFISGDTWRSDDEGATWELHARAGASAWIGSGDFLRSAVSPSGQICMIAWDAAGNLMQLASDDGVASTSRVVDLATVGADASIAALPTGEFIVAYARPADSFVLVRKLASAWQPLDDTTASVVISEACSEVAVVADPDGLLWLFVATTAAPQDVRLYVSADGGTTWQRMDYGPLHVCTTSADFLSGWVATAAAGQILIAHTWTASTDNHDGSVGLVTLGGWGNITAGRVVGEGLYHRPGAGPATSGTAGKTWLPIELPGDTALYTMGGAGTETLVDGELEIVTAGSTKTYTSTTGTSLNRSLVFQIRVASGGSITADDVSIQARIANGTADYDIAVRFSTTGLRVIDQNSGATLATKTVDLTTTLQVIVQAAPDAGAGVWYRRPGAPEWTEAWTGSLTNDGATPAATARIQWGHLAASASTSYWRMFSEVFDGHLGRGLGVTISGLPAYVAKGRPITNLPVPLPAEIGDSGGDVPWLSVLAGPGALNEVHTVDADHDFPIEHLFPSVSPSPAETWRGTRVPSGADQEVVTWDFAQATTLGDTMALLALNVNWKTALLQYYDGANWQTAGTMDLATGFSGLDYAISGDVVVPGASTPAGGRFLQENELAGCTILVETGGGASQAARRILSNTAGWWQPSSAGTMRRPRLIIDGATGTEDATGQCDIVWKSGVLVVHHAAVQARRYWRVRVTVPQVCAESYFEAGILVPLAVRAIGAEPDWGWSYEVAPNAETRRSRRGTTRVRELGPPIRTWTFGWPEGVDLRELRSGTGKDYVGSSAGSTLPMGAAEDVPWFLHGILERMQSGAVPALVLANVPNTNGTTITDRTRFLWGRMTTSVRQDHITGDEGEEEIVRVATISFEELV